MLKFFAEKNVSSFCTAKATHIFSAKNIRLLYIESAKTVNEMTLNELVKLTMLWTIGPDCLDALAGSFLDAYGQTSMSLETWKFVLNRGRSNHWGLIIAPGGNGE